MIQTTHSVKTSTTRNGTFEVDDIYDISERKWGKDKYKEVLTAYFEEVMEYMLDTGNDVEMRHRMGTFCIRKEKVDFIVRENGKVYTNCFVNKRATIEAQKLDPDADIIRHLDMDYIIKPKWFKGVFKNRKSYYFKQSAKFSKRLYEKAIRNETENVNELYNNRDFNREDRQG
jgi:hypothetical protein